MSLVLRSSIDGGIAYQDGSAAANVAPLELVEAIDWAGPRPRCFVAFTGTVGVIDKIRPSTSFRAELSCPGLEPLELAYEVETVPGSRRLNGQEVEPIGSYVSTGSGSGSGSGSGGSHPHEGCTTKVKPHSGVKSVIGFSSRESRCTLKMLAIGAASVIWFDARCSQ